MAQSYVWIRRITAFGPFSRFSAYPYSLFHGMCVRDGEEAIVRHTKGRVPYENVSVIYNCFGAWEVVHPSLYLLLSKRVIDSMGVVANVDFHQVDVVKTVDIPYKDDSKDEFLVERLSNVSPKQLLLTAPASGVPPDGGLYELIATNINDVSDKFLQPREQLFRFEASNKVLRVGLQESIIEEFPIIQSEMAIGIQNDVWSVIAPYFNPMFFEVGVLQQ